MVVKVLWIFFHKKDKKWTKVLFSLYKYISVDLNEQSIDIYLTYFKPYFQICFLFWNRGKYFMKNVTLLSKILHKVSFFCSYFPLPIFYRIYNFIKNSKTFSFSHVAGTFSRANITNIFHITKSAFQWQAYSFSSLFILDVTT